VGPCVSDWAGSLKSLGPNEVALVAVVMPAYLINSILANMLRHPKRCHIFQSLIKCHSATSALQREMH